MALPSGAIRLKYIEGTGAQYLDTGVAHSSSSKIVLKTNVAYTSLPNAYQLMGFNGNVYNFAGVQGSTWRNNPSGTVIIGDRYDLEYGVQGYTSYFSVNGVSQSGTRQQIDFTHNLFLFAVYAAAADDYHYPMFFSYCKMYDAEVLVNDKTVRDYIPCQLASGEVGLWDNINSVFYGDVAGVGFVAGPAAIPYIASLAGENGGVLVDNTIYSVPKDAVLGKSLVGGTAYNITQGKTFVGGTAYDISLSTLITVEITGSGGTNCAYAIINGMQYIAPASGIQVSSGDVITFATTSIVTTAVADLIIDGVTISTALGGWNVYDWTVPDGITQITIALSGPSYGKIIVTTS